MSQQTRPLVAAAALGDLPASPATILLPDFHRQFSLLLLTGGVVLVAAAGNIPAAEPAASAAGPYREEVRLRSGDSVAESLDRQKNLNFSTVRIDGEKSDAALSALTAGQIANAVATKVPTPDLDADTIGGELQLTSRRAYEQKEPTLRGTFAISHDPLAGRPAPEVSVTHGRSFGSRRQFGYLATFEYAAGRDADEEIELEWREGMAEPARFDASGTSEVSAETNFNGSVDWKFGPASFAFARLEAQAAAEQMHRRQLGFDLPAAMSPEPEAADTRTGGTLRRVVEEGRFRQRGLTLAAGATHGWEPWRMELRLTHRSAREQTPEERSYEFAEQNVAFRYRRPEPAFPRVTGLAADFPGDPARQELTEFQVHRTDDRESDDVASFDLTRAPGDFPVGIKIGGKARLQRTTRDQRHEIHEPVGTTLRVADATGAPDGRRILSDRYSLDGFPVPDRLRMLLAAQPDRLAIDEAKTRGDTDPANFDVRQRILAGYARVDLARGANQFVLGARVEHTASRFDAFEVSFDEAGRYEATRAVAARNRFTQVFPGIHASRRVSRHVTVFASWTRSLRRPDYTDAVPARRISRFDRTIEEGNASLQPAVYTNQDLAADYAYPAGGHISLELFRREIGDPTIVRRTFLSDGPFAGYEHTQPESGGRARLTGVQLTWRQGLGAFATVFEGLEFEINSTHERSRQVVENRPGEALDLTGRPGHELALQLSYDRGPYDVSLEYTRTGRHLESLGATAAGDVHLEPLARWDLRIGRRLTQGARVFLEMENLAGAPDRSYQGSPSRPRYYKRDVREYRLGVKWSG